MKKVLLFPLLQMPSGHHQVADTIASYLIERDETIVCKKIDLLSTWNSLIESMVTKTYLEWIDHFPKTYAWTYKHMAHHSNAHRSYIYYELLFLKTMKQIITEENPDLIFCTHGFPSYFLNRLKMKDQCDIPVINVYTDFFINDIWGREMIDFHFVPTQSVKSDLIQDHISENSIFITGIPIAEQFMQKDSKPTHDHSRWNVLISGGSIGAGNIIDLLASQNSDKGIDYFVLCGKNKKLYEKIKKLNYKHIHPLPYVTSKVKMNELYNLADAIITKPGGVTISEALQKGIPIFIHSALPGQEEINLQLLNELNLVNEINDEEILSDQIIHFFENPTLMEQYHHSLQSYFSDIQVGNPMEIYNLIKHLLESTTGQEQPIMKVENNH